MLIFLIQNIFAVITVQFYDGLATQHMIVIKKDYIEDRIHIEGGQNTYTIPNSLIDGANTQILIYNYPPSIIPSEPPQAKLMAIINFDPTTNIIIRRVEEDNNQLIIIPPLLVTAPVKLCLTTKSKNECYR